MAIVVVMKVIVTSSSDECTDAEPAASELSDQHDMLEHAYKVASDAFQVCPDGTLVGGAATLHVMETFPSHWLFAKMTLPLKTCVLRLDRLLAGFLME